MLRVTILGAGDLGAAVTDRLARRDAAATVRVVDENERVAAGKVLDIMQSAALHGFAAKVTAQSPWDGDAADVIVIADSVENGEWRGETGLMMVKRAAELHPFAAILCAGPAQRELVERGARELKIDRKRLAGTAPEALAAAVRALVAVETGTSPRDVSLTILGVPPSYLLVPWEDASVAGLQAGHALTEPARRRLISRASGLWPPGPIALAAAAVEAIDCIEGRSRRILACFVAPDDSTGVRVRAAALPVRFDRRGVMEVIVPPLNSHDRVMLDNAMAL
jgi:lactate/malate dehydrogenase, NAD binding domain